MYNLKICARGLQKNLYPFIVRSTRKMVVFGDNQKLSGRHKLFTKRDDRESESREYGEGFYLTERNTISESVIANILQVMVGLPPVSTLSSPEAGNPEWDEECVSAARKSAIHCLSIVEEKRTYRNVNLSSNANKTFTEMWLDGEYRSVGVPRMGYDRTRTLLDRAGLWNEFYELACKYDPAAMDNHNTHKVLETLNAFKRNPDVQQFIKHCTIKGGTAFHDIISGTDSMHSSGTLNCEQNKGIGQTGPNSDPALSIADRVVRGVSNILKLDLDIYIQVSDEMLMMIEKHSPGVTSCLDGGLAWAELCGEKPATATIRPWPYFRDDGHHMHKTMPLSEIIPEVGS